MQTRPSCAVLGPIVLGLVVVGAANSWAGKPSTPAVATAVVTTQQQAPESPTTQGYAYDPAGRRDPFVSLMQHGSDPRAGGASRPAGLPGLPVGEAALKGIVQSRTGYVAMLQAPDDKTYIVRSGDKLFDATIKAITADAVIFVQQVTDPLSLVKQREIRRPLRPTEEGK